MKMIRHQGSLLFSQKSIVLLGILFVSLFILLFAPARSLATQVVYSVAPTAFHLSDAVAGTGDSFLTNFRSKQALVYENARLRADNSRMEAQVLDRNLLEEKVASLEGSLGRVVSDNRVAADVIVGFGQSAYDLLVIDVGGDHGIQKGDSVVYAGEGVVGEIAEVSPFTSKVKLFSTPGEEYLVLLGAHSVSATAHGEGNGNFEAKIPQDSTVAVGDRVIVPKGNLILGEVQLIDKKPGMPFWTVFFRSSFNPTEIRSVEVVLGPR
jgi:cell shape-determining protein MreC